MQQQHSQRAAQPNTKLLYIHEDNRIGQKGMSKMMIHINLNLRHEKPKILIKVPRFPTTVGLE